MLTVDVVYSEYFIWPIYLNISFFNIYLNPTNLRINRYKLFIRIKLTNERNDLIVIAIRNKFSLLSHQLLINSRFHSIKCPCFVMCNLNIFSFMLPCLVKWNVKNQRNSPIFASKCLNTPVISVSRINCEYELSKLVI